MSMRRAVALVLVAAASAGCAAVFKGSKQSVHLDAVPQAVDVSVQGNYLGQTPADIELDRDHTQTLKFAKDGYESRDVIITRKNDTPWFFWDIATCVVPITLCIPLLVDAISGSWYSFDDRFAAKLEPRVQPALAPAPPIVPAAPAPPAGQPYGSAGE
jgi:hypothetical protein